MTLQYQGSLPEQSAVVVDGEVVLPLTAGQGLTSAFLDGLPTALAQRLRPAARTLVRGIALTAVDSGGRTPRR